MRSGRGASNMKHNSQAMLGIVLAASLLQFAVFAEDNNASTQKPPPSKLPNVLIIGDSISMGYKQGITVNDLYSLALPHLKEWQSADGCHFATYEPLAKQVATTIADALGRQSKEVKPAAENN